MPPKKKDEEIDPALLPPWLGMIVRFSYECSIENSEKVQEALTNANFEAKKVITRNDIINYGKEKGLYVDPNQLTEKQKKDKNIAEIPTELTPELLGKIFVTYYNDMVLQERKAKKEKQDAIAAGKDITEKKDKKDPKAAKQTKDKKKVVEEVKEEEKKEEPPLDSQMQKACDFVYILADYPETQAEFQELSKQGGAVDLVVRLKEKVIHHKTLEEIEGDDKKDDYEEDLKNRLDEAVETIDDEEKKLEENAQKEEIRRRNQEFIQKNLQIVDGFKYARLLSSKKGNIRNSTVREVVCVFDDDFEMEELLNTIKRQVYEEICFYSLDFVAYQEWIKDKKTVPLVEKEVPVVEQDPAKDLEKEQQLLQQQQQQQKQEQQRPPSKQDKKDPKKQAKGGKEADAKKEEPAPTEDPQLKAPKPEEKEKEKPIDADQLNIYEKQLRTLQEDQITVGGMLEALIDEVSHQTNASNNEEANQEKDEIEKMLLDFERNVMDETSRFRASVTSQTMLNEEDLKNPYQYVMNESDAIRTKTQESQFYNQEYVRIREHYIFDRIKLPGLDRSHMPERAEKSESLRKAEKAQLHPFISFEISDFNRYQVLEILEQLMNERDKFKDNWNFGDKIYEERLNPVVLRQRLYNALLFEPELEYKYFDQDDALLLVLFFNCPPGRIYRKKWNNPWKVIPNVENWIQFFKNNEKNFMNEFYYDLDYQLVENLHERTKFMYPNDKGVIMCSQFKVGDEVFNHYRVIKENILFGIKKPQNQENIFSELWAEFENRSKLLVEMEKQNNNKIARQSLLEPAKESEVNINGEDQPVHEGGEHSPEDLQQEIKSPEGEEEIFGLTFSLTLPNGLIVKFLSNGDILQSFYTSTKTKKGKAFDEVITDNYDREDASEVEKNRLVTSKGSVIRYMKDGSIQVMYANGNFSLFKKNTETWISTNNKGLRKAKRLRDGAEFELDRVESAKKTDPETGCKILIREDKVIVINYPDGSTYTEHRDGTKFLTSPDGNVITVEHKNYATVKVTYDPVKARMGTTIGMGSSSAYQGFDNIMERSYNGRVTETYMPDGSLIKGYLERRELEGYQNFEISNIHLIYQPDGSVLKLKETGEVVVVSATDRHQLNIQGENRIDDDIDYFLQLFGIPEERKRGVYTANLTNKNIWTRDDQGNFFSISSTGETVGKIAVSLDLNQNDPQDVTIRPSTPDFYEGEFIDEQNQFLPPLDEFIPPRVFILNNDNTGSELFNEEQLGHYFRIKSKDVDCTKIVEEQVPGIANCQSITFLTRYQDLDEKKKVFVNPLIPKNVDIIPQTQAIKQEPTHIKFTYRNFLKYLDLDEEKREKLHKDLEKYNIWKQNQKKESNEFGIRERTQEDKEKEFEVQQKIIETRQQTFHMDTYAEAFERVEKRDIPLLYDKYLKQLRGITEKKEEASRDDHQKKKSEVPKSWLDKLKKGQTAQVKEEKNTLGIDFSQVDLNEIGFVGNYFSTYNGNQFYNTLPHSDIKDVLERKAQLRKTRELIKLDPSLADDEDKKPQPQAVVVVEKNISQPKKKDQSQSKTLAMTVTPSFNMRQDIEKRERDLESQRKAEQYHMSKTHKFDVYGKDRQEKPQVNCLDRPVPEKILNTKYIVTESSTERRVRISSMARRLHLYAPSIDNVRTQGTHEIMKMSMDKKNDRDLLQEKKELMTTASVTDPLKRDLLIRPVSIDFGKIGAELEYEMVVKVTNEDGLPQRITVRQPQKQFIIVRQVELGPIAMGITREIIVQIKAGEQNIGTFYDYFEILSKHDVYRIPISGEVKERTATDIVKPSKKNRMKFVRNSNELTGSAKKVDISESRISDGYPSMHYDKNIKLDMSLKKKTEESQYSGYGYDDN